MPARFQLIRTHYMIVSPAKEADGPPGLSSVALRSGLFIAAILTVLLAMTVMARADGYTMRPGEAQSGTLLFKSVKEGEFVQAPVVASDYDITVSGPTARTRVTQHFYNPTDGWVEGVYVYPLPDQSAVDTLKVVIGNRVIVGEIKERQAAKRIYEQAKAEGKKAALLEQERPNIFTNSLANIGPGETIVVQIEYQQTIPHRDNEFSLRVPLVVAPRYNPPGLLHTAALTIGRPDEGDPVPDRARITPPVLNPATHGPVNPVTLTVRLQAGFSLGDVKSHHHKITSRGISKDTRIIRIKGAVPADRDFELTWSPKRGRDAEAGLFHERRGGDDYLLAFVTPPSAKASEVRKRREMIFVIDTSGSMGGASIMQAKASLDAALQRLSPGDRFNIIRFASSHTALFPGAVPATAENLDQAHRFVSGLQAGGGTNMVPAMRLALIDPNPEAAGTLRQVVFLTDGAIGNEGQLFQTIAAGLGRSRIFMIGIGSAPNSYLMNHAADIGRGSVTHIGNASQVGERMSALFNKLEKPSVTDLRIEFSDGDADITPQILPDLYAEETLKIAAKLGSFKGKVKVSGRIGDRLWERALRLRSAEEAKGISKLWARARIAEAEIDMRLGRIGRAVANSQILSLALEHGLVSRLTSLVAVDRTPDRPADAPLRRADVPLNLPAGWEFDKVFGRNGPRDASRGEVLPETQYRDARHDGGYLKKIASLPHPASAGANTGQTRKGISLPTTGTDSLLDIRLGLLIVITSMLLMMFARSMKRTSRS